MRRPRDSQRSRVYRAEAALNTMGRRFDTLEEAQSYVNGILASRYLPRHYRVPRRITVELRRTGTKGWSANLRRVVRLPRGCTQVLLLHEVAHQLTDCTYGHDIPGHGWQFAATFLDLIGHYMGTSVRDQLRENYQTERVRFRAPRQRKPLTADQKAELAERLVKVRLVKAYGQQAAEELADSQ